MNNERQQITLDDLAKASGVSRATASRAINGRPGVSAAVAKRVQMVAESLGYQPNVAARTLAGGRSGIIGLVMPENLRPTDPCGLKLIQEINRSLASRNIAMMLWISSDVGSNVLEFASRGQIDGIIVSAPLVTDAWVGELLGSGRPTVLLDRPPPGRNAHVIHNANTTGSMAAVAHLVKNGRHRIAHIAGPKSRSDAQDRRTGFLRACAETGQPTDGFVADGDYTRDSGHYAMRQLLPVKPDAVFAANDAMALGAIDAIIEAGLRVPTDIAVVGFDNSQPAHFSNPPLTSVQHKIEDLAEATVTLLEMVIANPDLAPTSTEIESTLLVRESSGSHRQG